MKTIDFDIEKAKTGYYKIVTKDGRPARIICWDKQDGDFKIVALIRDSDGYEYCQSYNVDGKSGECDKDLDLCLQVDEKDELTWEDLTKFEYAVAKALYDEYFIKTNNQDILEYIKQVANRLYEAAENQFIQEQTFKEINNEVKQHELLYRDGKSDIEKKEPAQPTFDGICLDTTKPNNKRYVEEHRVKSIDEQDEQVLRRHITNDSISYLAMKVLKEKGWCVSEVSESTEEDIVKKYISENAILGTVLKVLKDCGWCVIKQDEVTDIHDLSKSITERMQRISNVKL